MVQKSGIDGCATISLSQISTLKALIVLCRADCSLNDKTGRFCISRTFTLQEVCRVKIVLDETSVGSTEKIGSIDSLSNSVDQSSCI